MKIDNTNRRLKNNIDKALIDLTKICLEREVLSVEDIKYIQDYFNNITNELHSIDSQITTVKLLTTGEVMLNEILKELKLNTDVISNTRIREIILSLIDEVSKTKDVDELYNLAITTLCVVGAACKLYLDNIASNTGTDFKEVEDLYEQ